MFLFISGAEIGFIIFIVVLLFGADKIPEFAKGMAKGINNIKHATNEINNSKENLVKDSDISKNIDSEIKKVKSEMDSVSGSIKRDL